MPPLNRAFALDERQHGAMVVGQQLHFDMTGSFEPPLEVDRGVAKCAARFGACRAYRVEHLGRARHHSAWLHGEVGGWVTPVLCLAMRDDEPHRRDGVWIMGVEHLANWLSARTPPRGTGSPQE